MKGAGNMAVSNDVGKIVNALFRGVSETAPKEVGSLLQNAFGIKDMGFLKFAKSASINANRFATEASSVFKGATDRVEMMANVLERLPVDVGSRLLSAVVKNVTRGLI